MALSHLANNPANGGDNLEDVEREVLPGGVVLFGEGSFQFDAVNLVLKYTVAQRRLREDEHNIFASDLANPFDQQFPLKRL